MAARAIWSGTISFGLISVPVKLYTAISKKSVRFNQINRVTGSRIAQKRVDASTGEEVSFEDIVKGYELGPDRYVTIDPDELDVLAPVKTKTIDLERFVDAAEIDPLVYDAAYYLSPDPAGEKPYALLAAAMAQKGKVAVGRMVLRSKEYLVALRSVDGLLVASTMVFADEVRPADGLAPENVEVAESELEMACSLVDSLAEPLDHASLRDEYREKVMELIEARAAGEAFEVPEPAEEPPAAPDLMAALQASLAAVRERSDAPAQKTSKTRKARAAEKAAL